MVYALGTGWGLIGGAIPFERAYFLMAVPCIVPALWCIIGAIRGLGSRNDAGEQDAGLWLSGSGWLLLAAGMMAKHVAISRAMPDAYASQATSMLTPLFLLLGVVCLLLGGGVSWFAWRREEERRS